MPEVDPFFAELDAEIAKVTAKSKLKLDAVALRRASLNMTLERHTRLRAAAELKSIQAILDADTWIPVRTGAFFTEQHCDGCGSVHYNFLQFMQEEQHITRKDSRRWVRTNLPDGQLPRETIIQPLSTHICSDCCEDHGFSAKSPTIRLLPHEGSLTVSATYQQGDINGPPITD